MARFSRKGWYIRTALRIGRCYREIIPSAMGDVVIDYPSEMVMRTIIEARMNWIDVSVAPVEDCPGANELLWTFRERSQYGQFIGSFLTFLAPSGSDIRRIRAVQVEANKEARRATAERSEIRRAMSPVSKTRATQTDSASSQRRL